VIRLAARLAVSGGRESMVRLVLTAIGVALGTALLLLAAAADPAIRAHQRQQAWQATGRDERDLTGPGDPLLWQLTRDGVDGEPLTVLRVAATGPTAPVPIGLPHVPAVGEAYVSPALDRLLDELPAGRLADRFPSAPSGTIGRGFLAGPEELVAVVGTSVEDLAGEEGVLEVHRVRSRPLAFEYTDLLRLVLGIGAVGLLLPVVVFVSTSTRLGAARREQRLAALRLAGATPGQANVAAAVEAAAAAAVGAALGAFGYLALRPRLAAAEIDGQPSFLRDVHVDPALLVAILVAIPALAAAVAIISIRRLRVSPLGVARRAVRARPTARRALPFVAGGIAFAATMALAGDSSGIGVVLAAMVSFALMTYGIVVAGPWLTLLVARCIGRFGRGPGALLAGRRLEDDPATGFRAVSGLVLAVFVTSVFSGVSPAVRSEGGAAARLLDDTAMAAFLPSGTSTAGAAGALEAAAAAGAGRGIVLRVGPAEPGGEPVTLLACDDVEVLDIAVRCQAGTAVRLRIGDELRVAPSPYTAADLAGFPAETIVVGTDGAADTTDRVRTAIQRALPGTVTWLGAEIEAEANGRLRQLDRLANLALAVSLLVAGCSLAVAVAGGIVERKRPFGLLRLSGMHLDELRRVAFLEAAAPLLFIALASTVLGLGVSAVVVPLTADQPWTMPSVWYWCSLGGGLSLALAVAAAALPLLGRTTAPSAVRFE
jgi:hypothetical protein